MTASGSAWTLIYPAFGVVVPKPGHIRIPLAYPMAKGDDEFKTLVDTWVFMMQGQGKIDDLFAHWILGRAASEARPRWSILNDVLRSDSAADQ